MKCVEKRDGSKVCRVGARTFTLHEGKSNKAAKRARGKALQRKYVCKRGNKKITKGPRKGQIAKNVFVACRPRTGAKRR